MEDVNRAASPGDSVGQPRPAAAALSSGGNAKPKVKQQPGGHSPSLHQSRDNSYIVKDQNPRFYEDPAFLASQVPGGALQKSKSSTAVKNDDIMTLRRSASEERKSAKLSRSDSYRRARPILSPAEVRKTSSRKSCDVADLDISSIHLEKDKSVKEVKSGGNNFFKNIRNQFSFSSLRRKSPKKPVLQSDDSYQKSGCDPSPGYSPSTSTTAVAPRMTSTPLHACIANGGRSESVPPRDEAPPPRRFRTAAVKNQFQRWSFAESTGREG